MNQILGRITEFFEAIPDFLRSHRIPIWIGLVIVVAFLAAGLPKMKLDMAMESWFREDDPAVVAFMKFRQTFGSDNGLYIVYKAKDGDIFSDQSLSALAAIQKDLSATVLEAADNQSSMLNHVLEIKSLINVSYMEVQGDLLISRDFVGEELPGSPEAREKLRKEALEHKDYPLFYLSEDSQFGGIFIRTDMGATPENEAKLSQEEAFKASMDTPMEGESTETGPIKYKKTPMGDFAIFVDEINAVLQKPEFADVFEFYPVGNPVIMKFFNDVLNIELSYILLGTVVLILIALFYLFRSFSAVIWPILIVILSIVCTLGLTSWLGMTMSMMLSLIIMMVLVVGIADSIHILSGYVYFRKLQYDHQTAMKVVMKKSGFACLLTSLTTAAGLLSMVFVPIPPIAVFGIAAAMGVLIAFLLTVILLPLLLDIWHPISLKQAERITSEREKIPFIQVLLSKIEPMAFQYHKTILLAFLLVAIVAVYGLTKVKVDSNMVELVEKGHPVYVAHTIVDKEMGGTQSMEIYLDFGKTDALKDPKVLNAMEEMQNYLLQEQPKFVVKAESLVNVVKNSYQVLNENREEMYVIPQEQKALSQTLFLFDSANREDRELLVTDNYDIGRITVRLKNYGSIDYLEFFEDVQNKANTIFGGLKTDYPKLDYQLTGGIALMMKLVDYMSWSQIQSFGLALIVITLMLLFVFGSPKVGLMGMIPNLFPVAVTFGTMGFFNIPLDGDTLIIAPVVIGIAVDDTIHFLTHFRTEMLETGKVSSAIANSIREVGQAITFSTIILVLGFSTLVLSTHQGMAHFGYLTAVAFTSAWLADLFLLPALCRFMKDKPAAVPSGKTATI